MNPALPSAAVLVTLLAACASPAARNSTSDAAPDLTAPRDGAEEDRDALAADARDVAAPDALDVADAPDTLDVADASDAPDASDVAADVTPDALADTAPPCPTGALCGGACVDTETAVAHCGACGRVCEAPPGATPVCARGWCMRRCDDGRADCDGDAANGCETDLNADRLHCGRCDTRCSTDRGMTACVAGTCQVVSCYGTDDLLDGMCLVLIPPRPIAPLSGSAVTSRRPTLRWAPNPKTIGASLELCRNRAMTAGCATIPLRASTYQPTDPLQPGPYFWRVRTAYGATVGMRPSPTWEFFVGRNDPARAVADTAAGPFVDFNHDGYSDLAVMAGGFVPPPGPPAPPPPTLTVWMGGEMVWRPAPPMRRVFTTPAPARPHVTSPLAPGDPDGDGDTDLVHASFDGSRVLLRTGGVDAWTEASARTILRPVGTISTFGAALSFGDVNGDGYPDLLLGSESAAGGAFIYNGGPTGLAATATYLPLATGDPNALAGRLVAVGDTDGDGYCDAVATSAPAGVATISEPARLFHGSASGLQATWEPLTVPDAPYFHRAAGGDVNGDGLADIVLVIVRGAGRYGWAYVFLGHRSGTPAPAVITLSGGSVESSFGGQLAVADVNGDGLSDIVAGAAEGPAFNERLYVFLGRAGGPATAFSASTLVAIPSNTNYIVAGAASDLDGDGGNEIGIGQGISPNPGTLPLYSWNAASPGLTLRWTLMGIAGHDAFGAPLAARFRASSRPLAAVRGGAGGAM